MPIVIGFCDAMATKDVRPCVEIRTHCSTEVTYNDNHVLSGKYVYDIVKFA